MSLRKIELCMTVGRAVDMQNATDHKKWSDAVGYLSTWNLTFPVVKIYPDGLTDMTALYSNEDGATKYVIGAVWHEDHYGFHS